MNGISLRHHVAVLIDADNVPLSYLEQVLNLSEYYGQVDVRRAYGDWKQRRPSVHEKLELLKIEPIQVNPVGKNATDHRLLVEVGEHIGNYILSDINAFVIVSGDGDFASACAYIQERGLRIVVIGSKKIAKDLRKSCDEFYYLENLDQKLEQLKKRHPIPPNDVREFWNLLFWAYHHLDKDRKFDWVSLDDLGKKLHEIPTYASRFSKYELSMYLKYYRQNFETRNQKVRWIIPPNA
jgi:uncharacterized LabA/DUF88 family protein